MARRPMPGPHDANEMHPALLPAADMPPVDGATRGGRYYSGMLGQCVSLP